VSLSVSAPFGWRCLTSPRMRRTPAPPHRTVRAVFSHTALRSPSAAGMHGNGPAWHGDLAATGDTTPAARGSSLAAIPSRVPHQRRGESAAPSLGSGYVVPTLRAVLWAAPTAWAARRRLRRSPYTPRLDSCGPLARLSRGALWSCPRMPSLLPRRAPDDLAAMVVI